MNATLSAPAQPSRRRRTAGLALALAAVALLALGAWQFFADPPQPWRLKWQIRHHLKKQSGTSDFRAEFRFPSKAEMSRVPGKSSAQGAGVGSHGELPKQDFDSLVEDYVRLQKETFALRRQVAKIDEELQRRRAQLAQASAATSAVTNAGPARPKAAAGVRERAESPQQDMAGKQQALADRERELAPILKELWAFQRAWAAEREAKQAAEAVELSRAWDEFSRDLRQRLADASSYPKIYQMIAQQLWIADRLLPSANPQHRRIAVGAAKQAARDALNEAEDGALASSICQAYVWANLELADATNRRSMFSVERWLDECADIFRRADDTNSLVRNYRLLLSKATTPQAADAARVQLAMAHEQSGEFAKAIEYLSQVKSTNDFRWALRRVPMLEQRAKRGR